MAAWKLKQIIPTRPTTHRGQNVTNLRGLSRAGHKADISYNHAVLPCMRRPTVITFWAALLLVLAASPLTAPFSTCSVADLLANRDAQISGVLQAKPAKDDPAAVLLITAARPSSLFATDASRLHGGLAAVPRHALQIPLRL